MALITSKDTKRIDIPHEPGQWIEFRPIAAGDLNLLQSINGQELKVTLDLVARVAQRWSYEPQLPEHDAEKLELLNKLDLDTFIWLTQELGETLLAASGVRKEAAATPLGNGSSPTLPTPAQPSSQASSVT